MKEVVLLDEADLAQIVCGPPKAVLMEKGKNCQNENIHLDSSLGNYICFV